MEETKIIFIKNLAASLLHEGKKMNAKELADKLNAAGFKTSNDVSYNGMRGTYQLVRAVYGRLKDAGLINEAEAVATSFVKYNGKPAWKKKDK